MAAELPTAKRCNALSEFSQKLADSTAKELVYPELETCGEGDSGFEKWRPGTSAAVSSSQDVFSHAYAVLGTSFEQGLQCFGGLFHGVYCFCCAELRLEIDGAWRNDRPQPFVDFSGRITEPHGEAAAAEATEAAWQGRNHEPLEPFEPYFAHGAMQTQIVKTIFRPIRCV